MAPLFMPLFFLLTLLVPIHDSLIKMNTSVKEIAALDKKVGDWAEEISSLVSLALSLNTALRGFHASCAAATITGTLPEVQALAEVTRLEQDLLLYQAQLLVQLQIPLSTFERSLNNPQRKLGRVCEMPDVLECIENTTFRVLTHDGSKPAGVKGEYQNCTSVRWHYADSRVRELQ